MRIKTLQIKNFRSLRELQTPSLSSTVVFHGPNNTGKSNILLALETIFASKVATTDVILPESEDDSTSLEPHRKTPFWNGRILNFSDSFYMGTVADIEFTVQLTVPSSHIAGIPEAEIIESFHKTGHDYQVKLAGRIVRRGDDGEIILETALINNKIVCKRRGENLDWFPSVNAGQLEETTSWRGSSCLVQRFDRRSSG